MQISFPGFFLLAISNMQAGKVLGKMSLGTTNKGQHFIQMGDLLFPDILDLHVLQKAGSPENSFSSHASIHWCELGFNTLSVRSLYFSPRQFFPKMTEGHSGGTEQLFPTS